MSMPGFTAEASLYMTSKYYNMIGTSVASSDNNSQQASVIPTFLKRMLERALS